MSIRTNNGWVIERGDSESCHPLYFSGFNPGNKDGCNEKWSYDHDCAIRFGRYKNAKSVAAGLVGRTPELHRLTAHQWVDD